MGTDKSERDVRPKSRLKSTIALSKRLMFQCNYQLVMKTGDIFDGSIKDETVFVLYPSIAGLIVDGSMFMVLQYHNDMTITTIIVRNKMFLI